MSSQADEQLLDRLGAALAQTPIEPSPAEVDAIRALVVDERFGAVVALPPARLPRQRLRHPLAAAGPARAGARTPRRSANRRRVGESGAHRGRFDPGHRIGGTRYRIGTGADRDHRGRFVRR